MCTDFGMKSEASMAKEEDIAAFLGACNAILDWASA